MYKIHLMKDRIRKILDKEALSNTKFADIIGIQRSAVSHILSGRNKPSLEVVQKILEAFTYVNSDWLLFGTGKMTKDIKQGNLFINEEETTNMNENEKNENNELTENSVTDRNFENLNEKLEIREADQLKKSELKIEKIVIFYSDKTMEVFIEK
jgi:transcriptional regulator with XRE-family HTH domain